METVGMIALSASLAIGLSCVASALAQGMIASAAVGGTVENEKLFAKLLVYAALPESFAIYGFVIAILLMFVFGQ